METTPEQRAERLLELYRVAKLHAASPGESVKLNGAYRQLNMGVWDCGTSACLFGSYCLTPFGKQFFRIGAKPDSFSSMAIPTPINHDDVTNPTDVMENAAEHFGINHYDAVYLFSPDSDQYDLEDRIPGYDDEDDWDEWEIDPHAVVAHVETVLRDYNVPF